MLAQEDQTRRRLNVDEWRALLRTSGIKYEYHNGWVYPLAGGSLAHGTIALNAQILLRAALEGASCWVHNSDVAVRLASSQYRFSDVTVSCDARDQPTRDRTEVQVPRVIIEVLSDSTEKDDRTTTFALCRACPSVQEYVLIATEQQGVEVYRRAEQAWLYRSYGPGSSVALDSIDARLPLEQLYRLTDVPLPNTPPASLP